MVFEKQAVDGTVAVIVATWGDRGFWEPMAEKAMDSVYKQTRLPDEIIRIHGEDALIRNKAAETASTDWLIFLDADDELDPHYIEAMLKGEGDIRYPMVSHVCFGKEGEPQELQKKPLTDGNYLVIGSMVRRKDFLRLGGFYDLPRSEDWHFWLRAWIDGLDFQLCRDAVYKMHIRKNSRNSASDAEIAALHNKIINFFTPLARARHLV